MGIFSKIGGAVGDLLSGGGLGEVLNVAKKDKKIVPLRPVGL